MRNKRWFFICVLAVAVMWGCMDAHTGNIVGTRLPSSSPSDPIASGVSEPGTWRGPAAGPPQIIYVSEAAQPAHPHRNLLDFLAANQNGSRRYENGTPVLQGSEDNSGNTAHRLQRVSMEQQPPLALNTPAGDPGGPHYTDMNLIVQLQKIEQENTLLKERLAILEDQFPRARPNSLSIHKYNKMYGGFIFQSFPPSDQYMLLVGEYESADEARMLSFRLRESALSVWVTAPDLTGRETHTVYVGSYDKYTDAQRQAEILQQAGLVKSVRITAGAVSE